MKYKPCWFHVNRVPPINLIRCDIKNRFDGILNGIFAIILALVGILDLFNFKEFFKIG